MVGPISHNWMGDKLRCQSPIIFTQRAEGPQYLWVWTAVQIMLQSPLTGRRKQTKTGEAMPIVLGSATICTRAECNVQPQLGWAVQSPGSFTAALALPTLARGTPVRWRRLISSSLRGFLLLQRQASD